MRGVRRFLSSLVPLTSTPVLEKSGSEWNSEFSADEMNLLYSFASLSDSAIMDRIREFHNVSYQLGLEESHEMVRGNLLQIFHQSEDRDPRL